MKSYKLIIFAAIIQFTMTGCSYVSDYVEGRLSKRASFSINAAYDGSSNVILSWTKTDTSLDFAGIEIYVTSEPNDEYVSYDLVAKRTFPSTNSLSSGSTITYTVPKETPAGIYFYRVGFIHWDEPYDKRPSLYTEDQPNYDIHTDIDEISGSARVDIN